MSRILIVANQTLGGDRLDAEIGRRIDAGDAHFHVLVPMIEPKLEESQWLPSDAQFGVPRAGDANADAVATARRRSQHRLDAMVGRISRLGGEADGEVGDSDPVKAAKDVLDRASFDEVIISTLPAGVSRWLKMDLPSRVDRMVDAPVVTVEAEPVAR